MEAACGRNEGDLDPYAVRALGNTGDDDNSGREESDDSEREVAGTTLWVLFLMASDSGCPCILSVVDISSPTEGKLELDCDQSSMVGLREDPPVGK